jgi:hypothetical protein
MTRKWRRRGVLLMGSVQLPIGGGGYIVRDAIVNLLPGDARAPG